MGPTVSEDRLAALREKLLDAAREMTRLLRLMQRQTRKRNRLNKTIANTRKRMLRAREATDELRRLCESQGVYPD